MARTIFLDKTLLAIARTAEQSLFAEQYANRRGLLQSLDIRFQLVTFLFILVLISFLHTPQSLWLIYASSLALAVFSRVPLWFFVKRVWLFVPLFSAAIVLPAVLNIITPGDPVLVLLKLSRKYAWGPYTIPAEIAVTRQGLWGGIIFVSRVAASVSFAVLLTLTRRWAEIFAGLRALFVPRIFVMTLSMTERYLFVFLRLIQDMYRARKSRSIRAFSAAIERGWTASRIGVTFRKSVEMSNDVYKAMLSRGFHGDFKTINRFRSSPGDYIWLMTVLAAGGILIMVERGLLR
ncbi:MAG: cobalt ECF transporter T component CbiQ [Betaproteobacteria bacterium]